MLSNQEIFDKVAAHLYKQNKKSMEEQGSCKYRGPNGTMCAVGCLIPDERYTPQLEGKLVSETPVLKALEGVVSQGSVGLLRTLQYVHDSHQPYLCGSFRSHLDTKLHRVAMDFSLSYTSPSESGGSSQSNSPGLDNEGKAV